MTNPYFKVAEFASQASEDEFRAFFLVVMRDHLAVALTTIGAIGAEPWMAEVMTALHERKKIVAIKVYRSHTGASLKDSKDAVEKIIAERFPN